MNQNEVEAVLGHEISHVANGDMVTLTLIQGVVNTFVIFLSRIIGNLVDRTLFGRGRDGEEREQRPGLLHPRASSSELVLGFLANMIVAVVLAVSRVPCGPWRRAAVGARQHDRRARATEVRA